MKSIVFYIKRDWTLFITILAFVLTVLFVNPIREMAILDDWAYAETTKYLLDTNTYKLHDWLTANIPFQAYWGGFFALIGGYSFSTLRISTLVLSLLGLIAFYHLAKEHGLNRIQAGILTLAFLSNYLYLLLSFSFMSNVPFESTLIIALYLYTKAIRLHSYFFMLLASLAASAAIMTRQFGFALVLGGFCIWALNPERRRTFKFFFVGLFLPVLAVIWQLLYSIFNPSWAGYLVKYQQKIYFDDLPLVVSNIIYRPSIMVQYIILFILPLLLFIFWDFFREIKSTKLFFTNRNNILMLTIISSYIFFNTMVSCIINDSCSLQIPITNHFPLIPVIVTPVTAMGGILLIRIFLIRICKSLPLKNRFLDIVTLFLLILNLSFYQIFDLYILVFLPYTLIVVGQHLSKWLNKYSKTITTFCIIILMVSSVMIRGLLEFKEAQWKAGNFLLDQGISTNQISCINFWEWDVYHKFADYLKYPHQEYSLNNVLMWRNMETQKAKFWVIRSVDNLDKNQQKFSIIKKIPYRNTLLKWNYLYIIERQI
jgi:hypothetical protein